MATDPTSMGICHSREARILKKKGYDITKRGEKDEYDEYEISLSLVNLVNAIYCAWTKSEYRQAMSYYEFLDKTLPPAPKLQK